MSIHSEFNACMYKDECKSNETTVQDLQQRLALKDLENLRLREALEVCKWDCNTGEVIGIAEQALSTSPQREDLDAYVEAQLNNVQWQHEWNDDGERCVKCGDKDWMNSQGCQPVIIRKDK